jgi:hypothetical protein
MTKINKEIMRMGIYICDRYEMDLYDSLILDDEYVFYTPSKSSTQFHTGITLFGKFERIKIKHNNKSFDFNLN